MSLYEPFVLEPAQRDPTPPDLLVRPAQAGDCLTVGQIAAARSGGSPSARAARFAAFLGERQAVDAGLLLVAQVGDAVVAFAKTEWFDWPPGPPPNAAPEGWYLSGVVVDPVWRRRGIGRRLTVARMDWLRSRTDRVYYVANAQNPVTVRMHEELGFREEARDVTVPGLTFEGGVGVLYVAELSGTAPIGPTPPRWGIL